MKGISLSTSALVVSWSFCIVTGALVQFQQLLFPGFVVLNLSMQKIIFFALISISYISNSEKNIDPTFFRIWTFGAACLALSFIYLLIGGELESVRLIRYFLASYLFYFAIPLAISIDENFQKYLFRFSLAILWPLLILGGFQFELNAPILDIGGEDVGFEIMSWDFYGQVRAFSLFMSGLDFGYFLALVGAYFVANIFSSRFTAFNTVGLISSMLGVLITYTRLAFIIYLLSLFSAGLLSTNQRSKRYVYVLPFIYLLIGYLIVIYLPGNASDFGLGDFVQDDSLFERFYYWNKALSIWLDSGFWGFWLGTGESQGASNPGFIVDSVYLNTLLQSGLVGFFGLFIGLISLWYFLVIRIRNYLNDYFVASVSFYSTFLFGFLLNTNQFVYLLFVLPCISLAVIARQK